jgi:SynChlorMet cassette radical SAM/SPASM protein ScmE
MGRRPYYAPRSLDIDITTHCNLRCSYCAHFTSDGDVDNDLSLEEWDKFFQECTSIGIMELTLSGGEPFFRKDTREIINSIIRNRMRFSALSNGTLIDDDFAEFLKNTGRCNSVQVSIDGPTPEFHDNFRGKGSFQKALNGLESLIRHGIYATSRITLNKENYRHLPETAKLLLEDLKLSNFSTNSVNYLGLGRENNDSMALSAEQFSEAISILDELQLKYPGRIKAQAGPQACARMWRQMEKAVNGDENAAKSSRCGFLGSCGCVWSGMAVLADGTMVPCSQLPQMTLGKINHDNLRNVWLNSPVLNSMRKRTEIKLSEFESCQDCKYQEFCRGGCPASAYTMFGSTDVPNRAIDSCYREFLKQGGTIPPEPEEV